MQKINFWCLLKKTFYIKWLGKTVSEEKHNVYVVVKLKYPLFYVILIFCFFAVLLAIIRHLACYIYKCNKNSFKLRTFLLESKTRQIGYCGDLKSDHSESGNIQNPDFLKVRFQIVLMKSDFKWSQPFKNQKNCRSSLEHFMYKQFFV